MNIISKLLNTAFKAKKGTDLHKYFGDKNLYIAEIGSSGRLALSTLTPKEREDFEYAEKHEESSAWHDENELYKYIKP